MLFKRNACEAGQTGRGSPSGRGVPALDVHKPWWDRALSTQLWLRGAGGDLPQPLPTTILGFGSSVRQGALFFLPCPSEDWRFIQMPIKLSAAQTRVTHRSSKRWGG